MVLYWCINNPNTKTLWVSPTYSQTSKVQKEIFKSLLDTDIVDSCNYSENYINLKNGSEIVFRSGERYDNIRGGTYDYCVMDEAAFLREEVWNEAVKPTLLVKGKKVLFLSTPKGRNYFYELYQRGMSDEYKDYKSYRGTSFDNPFANKKEIEDAKKTLPENVFRQEYMADFIDDGGEVFMNLNNITFDEYPEPNGKLYGGIDLGRMVDYSVLTIMNEEGQVVDIYRSNKKEWDTIVDEMVMYLKKYKPITYVETNSIGDVLFEQIKKRYPKVYPFKTTSSSKQDIIEGLIYDMNEGNIQIPDRGLYTPLYDELSVFTYQYSPTTRNVKYGSPNGFHDDCVMSLAICNHSRKTNKNKGKYTYIS